jgi:hypothetical protein
LDVRVLIRADDDDDDDDGGGDYGDDLLGLFQE